jgi:hypothetical protein
MCSSCFAVGLQSSVVMLRQGTATGDIYVDVGLKAGDMFRLMSETHGHSCDTEVESDAYLGISFAKRSKSNDLDLIRQVLWVVVCASLARSM